MNATTKKKKWLWFATLYLSSLVFFAALSLLVKYILYIFL